MTSSRRTFLAAATVAGGAALAAPVAAAPAPSATFDRAAFEARIRRPFPHRQVFGSGSVADGALFGFIANSLDAYERGFGEGPGTLHPAAVLYHRAVVMALNDDAWRTFAVGDVIRRAFDRTAVSDGNVNPYLRAARGRSIPELQRRGMSLFVCQNALDDFARQTSTTSDVLKTHLIPDAMIVPAGVAAINALQEERFTLFVVAV